MRQPLHPTVSKMLFFCWLIFSFSAVYFSESLFRNTSCKYYGILTALPGATNSIARFLIERKLYEEPPHNPLAGLRIYDPSSNEIFYAIRESSVFATNVFNEKDFFQREVSKKVETIFKTAPYPMKKLALRISHTKRLPLNYELYGRSIFSEGWKPVSQGKMLPVSASTQKEDECWYEIEGDLGKRFPHYRLMLHTTNKLSFKVSQIVLKFMDYEVLFPHKGNTSCIAFFCGATSIAPSYQTIQEIAATHPTKIDTWLLSGIQPNKEFLETIKDKPLWQSPERLFRLGIAFTAFIIVWTIIRTKRSVAKMERDLR